MSKIIFEKKSIPHIKTPANMRDISASKQKELLRRIAIPVISIA
jgi:hypothetical protein